LSILSPPQSLTVAEGAPVNFNVLTSGIEPIRYQWLFDSVPLSNETNSLLSFASVGLTNAGVYRVVVTNAYLGIISAPAVLTIVGEPLLSIVAERTNVLITCRGDPGRIHRLLRATDLAPGASWTAIATNALSGAGTVVWTLPAPTNGPAYYRAATP